MNNFQFDYEGIIPLNYKGKQNINDDLDEILKNTINTTIDWKKRENSLKKLGQICLGDQGKSDIFIKTFNGQLATHLGIQMADLRSSVMKEACRITSLCAKELGIAIEQGATYLLTQYVLFKIAGSANRVISDSSSKCILNLVKYVNSIKIISNVCEQKTMKSNFVRNICSQCILYIVTCYKKNLIVKTNNILEDAMKSLLSDANGDVRATTRRAFITYRKRFQDEGDQLFDNLEKNAQKQIIEDEKKYGDSIIVDPEDGGEITFENPKNKAYLYNTSNKPKSHEVKYNNNKDNINIDKACSTFQKDFKSEEFNYNENEKENENESENNVDSNLHLHSKHFSDTTGFSDNTQNDKSEDNINKNTNQNTNTNQNKLRSKANKSFKGKETVNPNNPFSKTTKLNNKELLKKLNDKFYTNTYQNQNSENAINNNYFNSDDTNYEKDKNNFEPQKNVKQYNSSLNKKPKPKKVINKNNNNNSNNIQNYNNNYNDNNNSNNYNNNKNNDYTQNKQQNNISSIKTNNLNINNYIQNNNNSNNISDNFNININKDSMEYKIIDKINQLSMYNNIKEKIKIFQYLFNSFNDILTDVNNNNISDITLRQFVDIHIEYIVYEDKSLTEQLIKNLMRMIFYLTQIFTSNDIRLIVKILMIKINMGEKSVSKLSYELLDLIRKKWKIEDIYYGIFDLLEEKKKGYNDVCYEYLTLLVIYCGSIFEDINHFRKIIQIICIGDMNSKKIGKLIEALYKNNPKNFVQVLQEQNYEDQKKLLYFLGDKIDSIYQEIKQNQDNITKNNNNNNNNTSGKIKRIINPKSNTNNNNNNELNEIKKYIENGNVKSFLDYIDDNGTYLPQFFMLLTDENYSNTKYIKNILNFIYSLISLSENSYNEISQNMEILIDQLIKFLLININNSFLVDMVKEIFNIIPNKINSEKYYKSISKYLNNNTNVILLQTLLICIKNNIINDKSKNLEKNLPYFIKDLLNMLNHPSSDVRKYAIYCCVELYMVLEHKFDPYLELLPKSQQNLINLFIKKKNG